MVGFATVTRSINAQAVEISRANSKCARGFWVLILAITLGLFLYQAGVNINLYLGYPISTSLKITHFKEMNFPQISLCARKPLTKAHAGLFNITSTEEADLLLSCLAVPPPALDRIQDAIYNSPAAAAKIGELTAKFENKHEEKLMIGRMTLYNTFLSCSLRGKTFPCTDIVSDQGYLADTQCFYLNHNESLKQSFPGHRGALDVVVSRNSTMQWPGEFENGWDLWLMPLHDESVGPLNPVVLPVASQINVIITKTTNSRLNTKSSPCVNKHVNVTSSTMACLFGCEAHQSIEACGCARIGTGGGFYKLPGCDPGRQADCSYNVSRHVDCECDDLPCKVTQYKAEVAHVGREDPLITHMKIFYTSLEATELTQARAITISGLLGTLGGLMSLWLGLKFASIVQLLYYGIKEVNPKKNKTPVNQCV